MRTTLDLPDDLHRIVTSLAAHTRSSLSRTAAELMRRGLSEAGNAGAPAFVVHRATGLPVVHTARVITPEHVKALKTSDEKTGPRQRAPVHLLDGNVLVALVSDGHVHHEAARRWFGSLDVPFATCPITQGTLLRLLNRLLGIDPRAASAVLAQLVAHPRHRFWPDAIGYGDVAWQGVMGHRQITDAYLAALARHHRGKLATFDRGLAALHADVAIGIEPGSP